MYVCMYYIYIYIYIYTYIYIYIYMFHDPDYPGSEDGVV